LYIWDLFVQNGIEVFFQASLAILKHYENSFLAATTGAEVLKILENLGTKRYIH
jgi:hypothetical protein